MEMFHTEDEGTKARPRRSRKVSRLQLQWAVKNEKEDLPVRGMEQVGENLGSLIASEEFADVVIECGDKVFHCHWVFLATKSPVFKAMLQADMKENRMKKVNIVGIKPEFVAEMLHFIYTGVTSN